MSLVVERCPHCSGRQQASNIQRVPAMDHVQSFAGEESAPMIDPENEEVRWCQ
jgi:hypothetical protein